MNLWGATPLLAAALLGGGTGAHVTTANHSIQRDAVQARPSGAVTPGSRPASTASSRPRSTASSAPSGTPSGTPSSTPSSTPSFSPASGTPALRQVGQRQWAVTVLVSDTSPACRGRAVYWLETTPATAAIRAHGTPQETGLAAPLATKVSPDGRKARSPSAGAATGSSCAVTVTFTGLRQVPRTAALVLDQAGTSSVIPLSVSRDVTLVDYLLIPAIAGLVIALVALVISIAKLASGYGLYGRGIFTDSSFWNRPILASGAWTLGDSWATNITAGLTVIATVLGTATATSSFFPGVAVDRFAIVNVVAGAIVAVSPLIFGILYAQYTRRHPGVTADATLTLACPATLDAATAVRLRKGTAVKLPSARTLRLRADVLAELPSAAAALLHGSSTIRLAAVAAASLPAGSAATLPAGTLVRLGKRRRWHVPEATEVRLTAGGTAELPAATEVRFAGEGPAMLPAGARAAALGVRTAPLSTTPVKLPDGRFGSVPGMTAVNLPAGATVVLRAGLAVTVSGSEPVTLPEDAPVRADLPTGLTTVTALAGTVATLAEGSTGRLVGAADDRAATIAVPAGAGIVVLAGATVSALKSDAGDWQAVQVKAGQTLQVPPGSDIRVLAGASMALPGGTDIAVQPGSSLSISGGAGALSISAADVWPAPDAKAADVPVGYPARVTLPGGARISVVGTADVTLPPAAVIAAPHHQKFTVGSPRPLQVPQAGNTIVASLGTVLIAALVTMFGIGAELGIVGVLTFGLSEASLAWRSIMLAAILAMAGLVVWYAQNAVRALADPQPGSSISSTPGTSFTL